jgi:hypothetical protein
LPPFEFTFNAQNIHTALGRFPIQYEASISSMLERVEQNPVSSFDNFDVIDELIESNECEVMQYQEIEIKNVSEFISADRDKPLRYGCFYESNLRNRCGDPSLELK